MFWTFIVTVTEVRPQMGHSQFRLPSSGSFAASSGCSRPKSITLHKLLCPRHNQINSATPRFDPSSYQMCTEKHYVHSCGHTARDRPNTKSTCIKRKRGFDCEVQHVYEYVSSHDCPTCQEIQAEQVPSTVDHDSDCCGCIVC